VVESNGDMEVLSINPFSGHHVGYGFFPSPVLHAAVCNVPARSL
jgi:hypothetical protein